MTKTTIATGTTGHLLYLADGTYCFRVYKNNGEFIDYDLRHFDLVVKILDNDASFYETPEGNFLDHSPFKE